MSEKKQPLYIKVKNKILDWILSGKYAEGDRLPPERELVKILKVSRITILGALRELENDGYIESRQGSGTFVTRNKRANRAIKREASIKITFGINGYYEFLNLYRYLISLFREEYPEIDVEPVSVRMSARPEQDPYILSIASGNIPTAGEFYMHADYAAANGLVPLENMDGFKEIEQNLRDNCMEHTLDASGELHVHAMPDRMNPKVIFVNNSILKAAGVDTTKFPESFDELLEWAGKTGRYTQSQSSGRYGVFIDPPTHCDSMISYYPYIWASDGYKAANSKDEFLSLLEGEGKWMDFMLRILEKGNPYRENRGMELFLAGHVGIMLSDPGRTLQTSKILVPDFEIKAMPVPPFARGGNTTATVGDMSIGIFRAGARSDEEIDAAWKWIKFLLRPDIQKIIAEAYWNIPANKSAELPYPDDPNYSLYLKTVEMGKAQYDFKDIRKVLTIFARELNDCFSRKIQIDECLKNTKNRILQNIY